jgi:SulP family sulfate permease
VVAYSIYGTLFFGAINKLETLLDPAQRHPEVVILELNHLVSLDTTGLEGLESLCKNLHKHGCALLLCNLNPQPESLIVRSGFADEIGPNNICGDIYGALARARDLLPRFIDEDNL